MSTRPRRAFVASTDGCEVVRIDSEAVACFRLTDERPEQHLRYFDRFAALATDKVTVIVTREVIGRWAVSEMDMLNDAEVLQLIEIAIDSRQVDIWRDALDIGGEFFDGAVPIAFVEALEQHAAGGRDPPPFGTQPLDHLLDEVIHLTLDDHSHMTEV